MYNQSDILEENERLVKDFQAVPFSKLVDTPHFYTFQKSLFFSHRDFDKFYSKLKKGERSALVSGLNPSGTLQLAHRVVFDTVLFFQREFKVQTFVPLSDDESYVAKKVATREDAVRHGLELIVDLLAYGYDKKLTKIVFDFVYPEIFSIAMTLSRSVTMSEIKAVYGYKNDNNIGLHFYPTVQAAHVILPEIKYGIKNTLVPIGPDEDAHLRLGRDIAERMGYTKPAILHSRFLPGMDGLKMSKSRPNAAIFLHDPPDVVEKKVKMAFSGGKDTIAEHRKYGGNPDIDIPFLYLFSFFLTEAESEELGDNYRKGEVLSGDLKNMLTEKINSFNAEFKKKREAIGFSDIKQVLLVDESKFDFLEKIFKSLKE
jgi:tryptophanyl-tRNA synthetase